MPPSLRIVWRELSALGLLNNATVSDFHARLVAACAPLSLDDFRALESSVSTGFREPPRPLGRWEMKVRHALHSTIFPYTTLESLRAADIVLRVHNPETLVEPAEDWRLVTGLVNAVKSRRAISFSPADEHFVCLHMHCLTEIKGSFTRIEMVPLLSEPGLPGLAPLPVPTFCSVELPRPGNARTVAVCGRVDPTPAYFGALTPAIATPGFLTMIGAKPTDIVRYHWRDTIMVDDLNAPVRAYENSVLAVKRASLQLPDGWRLQWSLQVNGVHIATLETF